MNSQTMLELIETTCNTILENEDLSLVETFLLASRVGVTVTALAWIAEENKDAIPVLIDTVIANGRDLFESLIRSRSFSDKTYQEIVETIKRINVWLTRN